MTSRGSPLASLLIISAIDLLLCCLTAGIMLFLVFQPSQRSDRSSAILGVSVEESDNGSAAGGGSQLAPTTIIVKMAYGDRLEPAGGSSGYKSIQGHDSSSTQSTTVLVSTSASADVLTLAPVRANRAFRGQIVLAVNGSLFTQDVGCGTGGRGQVTIDPEQDEPIQAKCSEITECLYGEALSDREYKYFHQFVKAADKVPEQALHCSRVDGSHLYTCDISVDRYAHWSEYTELRQDPICSEAR